VSLLLELGLALIEVVEHGRLGVDDLITILADFGFRQNLFAVVCHVFVPLPLHL